MIEANFDKAKEIALKTVEVYEKLHGYCPMDFTFAQILLLYGTFTSIKEDSPLKITFTDFMNDVNILLRALHIQNT